MYISLVLLLIAHTVGSQTWKCPAGQTGIECTKIEVLASAFSSESTTASVGTYIQQEGALCTSRKVYFNAAKNTFLAYTHVDFWPYLSAWMVFENDPRSSTICTLGKLSGLAEIQQTPGVLLYLQTSDLTTTHRNDKTWKAVTSHSFFDSDSTVSSKCIEGCSNCAAGKHSQGCDRLTLNLDQSTFIFPPDATRLSGTYERLGTGTNEHAVYARIKEVTPVDQPNVHDVWISYLFFTVYQLNSVVVFEEGYCLQWTGVPFPDMHLDSCQYIAKNPGSSVRMTDPATPANGPIGEQLTWTVNTYTGNPATQNDEFPVAPTMRFVCQGCAACPSGWSSSAGSTACSVCPLGFYSGEINSALCKACPNGYFGTKKKASSCVLCSSGKYSTTPANNKGIVDCTECQHGHYSIDTQPNANCLGCPSGYYQEAKGQADCKSCPKGFVNVGTDGKASECIECLVGKYSATPASVQCMFCPAGYYQGLVGSSACVVCSDRSVSDVGANRCIECPALSYVYDYNHSGTTMRYQGGKRFTPSKRECVLCPMCTLQKNGCGTCDASQGFIQNDGFWNKNRTTLPPSMKSFPPPSFNEVFLRCDVIGFRDYRDYDYKNNRAGRTNTTKEQLRIVFDLLDEETACQVNRNGSQVCKDGYRGFLCGSCAATHGHGSRKSTCQRCDRSKVGPWLRIITVMVIGMCIVAYIVKRKTRKQSASLERVGLL
jgi:hypothetical protein